MGEIDYFQKLKRSKDIEPDKHDGSYELVNEVVRALSRADKAGFGYEDIDLLYFSTVGTFKDGYDSKERRIERSHIRKEDKAKLITLLRQLKKNAAEGKYENTVWGTREPSIGMFGTGFLSFSKFDMKNEDIARFISMCIDIQNEDDEEKVLRIAERGLGQRIKGLGVGAVSQILHCIKPDVFPILNSGKSMGREVYTKLLNLPLVNPHDPTRYIENVRMIREYRNTNFSFKNYRVFDVVAMEEHPGDTIYDCISRAGFHFPATLITDYLLALKTKPFVILTGVSGTGKTKLAQLVADYFTGEEKERVAFVPVRPDWTDNQGLLGFYNLITQRYEPTELLKLLLRAAEDPENPYFLILDEMNLAKVEHYFSDFLSCLESGTPILLHDQPEDLPFSDGEREYLIPPRLKIPENLYITGTVNVDETTYMFSPKVLDRAFTLEFDRVEAGAYLGLEEASSEEDFRLKEGFTLLPQEHATRAHASALSPDLKGLLASLEEMLEPYRLHFGYRVINEISLYLENAKEYVSESPTAADTAFDLCLLHKVLPKLHGNRGELEEPLARLLFFSFGLAPPEDPAGSFESFQARPPLLSRSQEEERSPRFPRTAAKVYRMWSTLRKRGFVSFVE